MQTTLPDSHNIEDSIRIPVANVVLEGNLCIPPQAKALILFIHGSGSSRFSARNKYVANVLNQLGFATLLFDLLTVKEEAYDIRTAALRFNIEFLAERVIEITKWLTEDKRTRGLKLGYFGASTGAAAALVGAARVPDLVGAIVSRGGRPDLADTALRSVKAPTLLIVGQNDPEVIDLNQEALKILSAPKSIKIVCRAGHLFEEPGTLEEVAMLAAIWFKKYLLKPSINFRPRDEASISL